MSYSLMLEKFFAKQKDFQEARDIVVRNSSGRVWLIGGAVYRTLAHLIHATQLEKCDFDFIVEFDDGMYNLPPGWSFSTNSHGNPKFIGPNGSIDFVPLCNIDSIQRIGLGPTIENYLKGVPLTVQAVAYNILEVDFIGDVGARAIESKTVGVNNRGELIRDMNKRGISSIDKYIRMKAESLGFIPLFESE